LSDAYLHHAAARIVRTFELYARNIDPDDADFQAFIRHYVSTKETKNPESIPYLELYKIIREGIREYLKKNQITKGRSRK
jgi:hypothetical protein